MEEILILGNGISRIPFDQQIRQWPGLLWGCNRAYLDFGEELDAINGHEDVMREAEKYRDAHGLKYQILGSAENPYTCKELYRQDSGTYLVAEALTRGLKVNVVGFDIGGLDLYSPGHEKHNKTAWVNRWRIILKDFGADRVTFWGYDHKPFLLSNRHPSEYARSYMHGKPHIDNDQYAWMVKAWDNNYDRIYALIPYAVLKNIGDRCWHLAEGNVVINTGESKKVPECVAEKYATLYSKDFVIEKI